MSERVSEIHWPEYVRGPIIMELLLDIWPDFNGRYARFDLSKPWVLDPRIIIPNPNGIARPGDLIIRKDHGEFHITHRAGRCVACDRLRRIRE